jgi:type VI protein secretion system component VasF
MFGRTRLYQDTGSPLIRGTTGARRRRVWLWVVLAAIVVAAVLVYLTLLR